MGSLVLTDSAECLACACSCLRRNFGRRLGVTFTLFAPFLHGHESDTNQSESGAPAWKMTNQADSWTRFDESGDHVLKISESVQFLNFKANPDGSQNPDPA